MKHASSRIKIPDYFSKNKFFAENTIPSTTSR
jgi:hypothetical protein